jgi:hypothetical protein
MIIVDFRVGAVAIVELRYDCKPKNEVPRIFSSMWLIAMYHTSINTIKSNNTSTLNFLVLSFSFYHYV